VGDREKKEDDKKQLVIFYTHVVNIKPKNLIYFRTLEEVQASGNRGGKTCKSEE